MRGGGVAPGPDFHGGIELHPHVAAAFENKAADGFRLREKHLRDGKEVEGQQQDEEELQA